MSSPSCVGLELLRGLTGRIVFHLYSVRSVISTAALDTTAPELSVTVPVMVRAPADWARKDVAGHSSSAAANARARSRFEDRFRLMRCATPYATVELLIEEDEAEKRQDPPLDAMGP